MVSGAFRYLTVFLCLTFSLVSGQSKNVVKIDTLFFCNGKISAVISTDSKGMYHGITMKFYPDGKPAETICYVHGTLSGHIISFSQEGDTSFVSTWKNNLLHGKCQAYYSLNRIMFTENYFAGKLEGPCRYLDTAGSLYEGKFQNFYNQEGNLKSRQAFCVKGKPQGEVFLYNGEDGSLLNRTQYKDGLPDGRALTYKADTVISISKYEQGEFIKEDDQHYLHHISVYDLFIREEKNTTHFLYQRALAFLRIGKPKKSLADLEKVLSADKRNFKAYYNRAVILADSLPKAAVSDLLQTIKLNRDFYPAYYNLGILYYRNGTYRKARDSFEKCLKLSPGHLPSVYNLSMTYGLLGDKNMQEYYRKELERLKEL